MFSTPRGPLSRALLCLLSIAPFGPLGLRGESPPPAAAPRPAGLQAHFPGRDPKLRWDRAGNLHLIYVEDRPAGAAVVYRRLGPDPFGPADVTPPGLATSARTESPPLLEILADGRLLAAYVVPLPGKWQSALKVQTSADRGKSWSAPISLHGEGKGAHSFLSAATTPEGEVTFAWLDSRSGHMGLYARSTRDGAAFSPERTLDPTTCQCCGTELLAGRGSDLWLVYRDLETGDVRDFRVLKSKASPPDFQAAGKLSDDRWAIQGCPETGARLAEGADGTLWAVWFTGGGQAGLYVSSSKDGGATFASRTPLTTLEQLGRHPAIGVLPDGRVAVLYQTTAEDDSTPVVARLRGADGSWGAARRLAPGGSYPRLAVEGERAAVALTCRSDERSEVFVAEWPVLESGAPDWGLCAPGRPS